MTNDEDYHGFESATGAEIKLCLQQPVMPELAACKKAPACRRNEDGVVQWLTIFHRVMLKGCPAEVEQTMFSAQLPRNLPSSFRDSPLHDSAMPIPRPLLENV
jgi:hypothetical protein